MHYFLKGMQDKNYNNNDWCIVVRDVSHLYEIWGETV